MCLRSPHLPLTAQDYFFGKFHPFSSQIESPNLWDIRVENITPDTT